MIDEVALENWSRGINNQAPANRLPEQSVRDLLNLDPGVNLEQRVGYERVAEGAACRAVMALGNKVLYVDGTSLMEFDTQTDTTRLLRTVAGVGPVAWCVFNHELFLSTVNEVLRYDGGTLRDWGVPDVVQQPGVTISDQKKGRRLYAATFVNAQGEEGGTTLAANVPNGTYSFDMPAPPPGGKTLLYVSANNGRTLYLQGMAWAAGPLVVNNPTDDTQTLATMHLRKPTPSRYLATEAGVILMAQGKSVAFTQPMTPHLTAPMSSFLQYPVEVGMVLGGSRGVYVSADKCYQVTNIESAAPKQSAVSDYPAVPGTGIILPDGRAAWLTRYGMSLESEDARLGIVTPTVGAFVPGESSEGTSGVVDNDGRQMVVTTLQGANRPNTLAASDYYEVEVIRP